MQACSQILNSATQAQSKRLRRRLQPSEMESGSTVLYQSAVMGSRKGQRLETRGRFPFPRRYEKAVLKKEGKRKKERKHISRAAISWGITGGCWRIFCCLLSTLLLMHGNGAAGSLVPSPPHDPIPSQGQPHRQHWRAPFPAEHSFITIFIQCLSRRCTDLLQWRKKRTQNLFSKDIQIS